MFPGKNKLKTTNKPYTRINKNASKVKYLNQAAVSVTARKLGVIIWTMITKKVQDQPPTEYLFLDQKRKLKVMLRIKKNIAKFDIKLEDVGFCNSLNMSYDI